MATRSILRARTLPVLAMAVFCLLITRSPHAWADPGDRSADAVWTELDPGAIARVALPFDPDRPAVSRVFQLDDLRLLGILHGVPMEHSLEALSAHVMLTLPMPDGTFSRFYIEESPVLSPRLQQALPEIRTYLARSVDQPGVTARLDRTPMGLHAMIRLPDDLVFVEPLPTREGPWYRSYLRSALEAPSNVRCEVSDEQGLVVTPLSTQLRTAPPSGASLRTYNMAISATGEYTQQFGGRAGASAQIATTVNQLNGIYEPEVSIHFTLVCLAIAPDPATDRYATPSTVDAALDALNTTVLDDTCGVNGYQIGHLFHRRASAYSGRADFAVVCGASKGNGASTGVDPTTSLFLIDLFAHEVGHQFNARHIFNSASGAPCTGARSAGDAYEIASGTTIMSYAFSGCPEDIPGTAIPFFNTHSFDQITDFREAGGNCGAATNTGNTAPNVNAGPNFTIPRGTPFTLTATGNDPDGDAITFQWEEFDLAAASSPPLDGGAAGPLFRGYNPSNSPIRTFPRLSDLINGTVSQFEILPTVDRVTDFRCTARDNRQGGGGVNYSQMRVTVQGDPFRVTAPNGGEELHADCEVAVTWTVGGGSVAPNVNILYSTDGGNTFPITLAANTPNDGAETVRLPCTTTTQGRVRVEAVGNVFFDISDGNFRVINDPPSITATVPLGALVNDQCVAIIPVTASASDDCRIDAADFTLDASSLDGRSTVAVQSFLTNQVTPDGVGGVGSVRVSDLTACPARVEVRLKAVDRCGLVTFDTHVVEVRDNTPPHIAVSLNRYNLWPPNHVLVPIHATVSVIDNCPVTSFELVSITSNEPENGLGDGDTAPDIVGAAYGTADVDFLLRAERQGGGSGRVYTITFRVTDGCGNTADDVERVRVVHDQSGNAVAVFGLTSDGGGIDPNAHAIVLVVPSVVQTDESADPAVTTGGTQRGAALQFDARAIVPDQALIGNARAVVPAGRIESIDVTGDGLMDRVLFYPADAVRAVLETVADAGPVGLHYVTDHAESFLVPDILLLGPRPDFPADVLARLGDEAQALDGGASGGVDGAQVGAAPSAIALAVPAVTRLAGVRPNPFMGATLVEYDLARASRVRIAVYDPLGRLVKTLQGGERAAGRYSVTWDGRDAAGSRVHAGIYFVRFDGGGVGQSRKAILMQ